MFRPRNVGYRIIYVGKRADRGQAGLVEFRMVAKKTVFSAFAKIACLIYTLFSWLLVMRPFSETQVAEKKAIFALNLEKNSSV